MANHINHNMSRAVALKPDKTLLISILYIKNANKAVSIVVVSSLVFFIIKNTNKYYLQHERPCCIGYTNSSRRREFVYPIQHGRSCCK